MTEKLCNPIEIAWDLLQVPEEERKELAHLFDYCEELVIEGDPLNSYVKECYGNFT